MAFTASMQAVSCAKPAAGAAPRARAAAAAVPARVASVGARVARPAAPARLRAAAGRAAGLRVCAAAGHAAFNRPGAVEVKEGKGGLPMVRCSGTLASPASPRAARRAAPRRAAPPRTPHGRCARAARRAPRIRARRAGAC
jgi:hypothetical protein